MDAVDMNLMTPFHLVAYGVHAVAVKILIEWGAAIDVKAQEQVAFLGFGSSESHAAAMQKLIVMGTTFNARAESQMLLGISAAVTVQGLKETILFHEALVTDADDSLG